MSLSTDIKRAVIETAVENLNAKADHPRSRHQLDASEGATLVAGLIFSSCRIPKLGRH